VDLGIGIQNGQLRWQSLSADMAYRRLGCQ
jgi:hypothetical protein